MTDEKNFKSQDKDTLESVYKDRLELLVYGYVYENSKNISIPMPNVLLKLIELWYNGQNEPKLKMNVISRDWTSFQAEFYLDKKANKLLNITSYELIFPHTNHDEVIATNIHDDDYFISYNTINTDTIKLNCQLIALDENDNILMKLKKKLDIKNFMPLPTSYRISRFDLIDKQKNGFLNLSEWVSSMKQLLINTKFHENELLYRRMFYFMIHIKDNYMDFDEFNNLTVNKKDVEDFVNLSNVFVHPFNGLIKILQDKLCRSTLSSENYNRFIYGWMVGQRYNGI